MVINGINRWIEGESWLSKSKKAIIFHRRYRRYRSRDNSYHLNFFTARGQWTYVRNVVQLTSMFILDMKRLMGRKLGHTDYFVSQFITGHIYIVVSEEHSSIRFIIWRKRVPYCLVRDTSDHVARNGRESCTSHWERLETLAS